MGVRLGGFGGLLILGRALASETDPGEGDAGHGSGAELTTQSGGQRVRGKGAFAAVGVPTGGEVGPIDPGVVPALGGFGEIEPLVFVGPGSDALAGSPGATGGGGVALTIGASGAGGPGTGARLPEVIVGEGQLGAFQGGEGFGQLIEVLRLPGELAEFAGRLRQLTAGVRTVLGGQVLARGLETFGDPSVIGGGFEGIRDFPKDFLNLIGLEAGGFESFDHFLEGIGGGVRLAALKLFGQVPAERGEFRRGLGFGETGGRFAKLLEILAGEFEVAEEAILVEFLEGAESVGKAGQVETGPGGVAGQLFEGLGEAAAGGRRIGAGRQACGRLPGLFKLTGQAVKRFSGVALRAFFQTVERRWRTRTGVGGGTGGLSESPKGGGRIERTGFLFKASSGAGEVLEGVGFRQPGLGQAIADGDRFLERLAERFGLRFWIFPFDLVADDLGHFPAGVPNQFGFPLSLAIGGRSVLGQEPERHQGGQQGQVPAGRAGKMKGEEAGGIESAHGGGGIGKDESGPGGWGGGVGDFQGGAQSLLEVMPAFQESGRQ